jgi:transketolase
MARSPGLVYLRTLRSDLPLLYPTDATFEVPGAKRVADGKDLLIAATGYMVHTAKALLPRLAELGISAALLDCYSFPLPGDLVLAEARRAGGRVLTLEDNYAALGSAVSELAAAAGADLVKVLAVDRHAKSAHTAEEVFDYVGLTDAAIVAVAQALVRGGGEGGR